jgi:hypothetical protein
MIAMLALQPAPKEPGPTVHRAIGEWTVVGSFLLLAFDVGYLVRCGGAAGGCLNGTAGPVGVGVLVASLAVLLAGVGLILRSRTRARRVHRGPVVPDVRPAAGPVPPPIIAFAPAIGPSVPVVPARVIVPGDPP